MSLEQYQEVVSQALLHFFQRYRHFIDDSPEIRPLVLYGSANLPYEPWTVTRAWQYAAEELETLEGSEERGDSHKQVFDILYNNWAININVAQHQAFVEFYNTYPLWGYVLTAKSQLYGYAAIGGALLPHINDPRIVPHIGRLTDKQQMLTLYRKYRSDPQTVTFLKHRPLMVEIMVEEQGLTPQLLHNAVISSSVNVLRQNRVSFSVLTPAKLNTASLNTEAFFLVFAISVENKEPIDNNRWAEVFGRIKNDHPALQSSIEKALEYTPPTDLPSMRVPIASALSFLNILLAAPAIARCFLTHPSTKLLILNSTVTYPRNTAAGRCFAHETISLLATSYLIGTPLSQYYQYDQLALLIEVANIHSDSQNYDITRTINLVLSNHSWTPKLLIAALTHVHVNRKEILDKLVDLSSPLPSYNRKYTPL